MSVSARIVESIVPSGMEGTVRKKKLISHSTKLNVRLRGMHTSGRTTPGRGETRHREYNEP